MGIIICLSLMLLVSSAFGDDEVCYVNDEGGLKVCYNGSMIFTRVIELNSNSNKTLVFDLRVNTNNTFSPYAFNNSHIMVIEISGGGSLPGDAHKSTTSLSLSRDSFAGMPELKKLALNYVIVDFNNENPLAPLESLTKLYFRDINLTEVPSTMLTAVPKLEELVLKYNLISVIRSNSFSPLKNLKKLDLTMNGINHIEPGAFDGLSQLESLTLFGNNFTGLPGIFRGMPKLNALDVAKTFDRNASQLQVGIFEGLPELESLNMADNGLKDVPMGVFDNLPSLKILDLSHNRIGESNSMGIFKNMTSLRNLDLSDNMIRTITPGTFGRLILHELNLGSNQINVIKTDTFNGLTVDRLNLWYNRIVDLEPNAFNGSTVEELDLRRNNLTKIDTDDFHGFHTKRLILISNKIETIAEGALNEIVTEKLSLHLNPIVDSFNETSLGLPKSVEVAY